MTSEEFLKMRLSMSQTYHAHKETMAHAAILVQFALAAAVIGIQEQEWPPVWTPEPLSLSKNMVAFLGVIFVWILIHVYIRWQLRNRRIAAMYVAALLKVLRKMTYSTISEEQQKLYGGELETATCFQTFIDHIIPWKATQVPTDECIKDYPNLFVDELKNAKTGAIRGEWIVSLGSIFMLIIILVRCWP